MSTPSIQVFFNGHMTQTVPFHKDSLSIGRMRENDVVIDNLAVSRFHAKITLHDSQVILEDQGSENGCFVNGKRVSKTVIHPEDEIIIGKHQLVLSYAALDDTPSLSFGSLFDESASKEAPASNAWDVSSTYMVDESTQEKILERIRQKAQNPNPPPPSSSHPLATLLIEKNGQVTDKILCNKPGITIGRAPDNDIVLDQPQVSRRHALIERKSSDYEIQDLDTGNGTFVNDVKITRRTLQAHDVITVGTYRLLFELEEPTHLGDDEETTKHARVSPPVKLEEEPPTPPAEEPSEEFSFPQIEIDKPEDEVTGTLSVNAVEKEEKIEERMPDQAQQMAASGSSLALEIRIDLTKLPEPLARLLRESATETTHIPIEIVFKKSDD